MFPVVLCHMRREILLVPSKRQVGGRGAEGTRRISLGRFFLCNSEETGGREAEFHAYEPTTWLITNSALPCNNGNNGDSQMIKQTK